LAERAGVARSLVGRVESGGDVQVGSLRRLLGALGCGVVVLPVSEAMYLEFKAKALEKRRREREWERVRRRLEARQDRMGPDAREAPGEPGPAQKSR
jgi:transcriptional regulator with XRE-family HTH domain